MNRERPGGKVETGSATASLRFALDIRPLQMSSRYQGTGAYCHNLVRHLMKVDPENTYLLFQRHGRPWRELPLPSNFNPVSVRRFYDQDQRFSPFWDQFFTPLDLLRIRPDLYHAVSIHYVCWWVPCPTVLTLFDMIPLIYPKGYMQTGFKHHMLYRFARSADRILAPSEHTRRDVHRLLGIPLERITVTHLAADERFKPVNDDARVKKVLRKYGIREPFILYVGGFTQKDPRRDVMQLVEVFQELHESGFRKLSLVLAGKHGAYSQVLMREMERSGRGKDVLFTGYLEQDDLPLVYNAARCFVFPSIYEGFGIPPLEAISCGIPTVAYNNSSLPEVLGDAGILVDEKNPRSLFEAIRTILTEDHLAETLRQKGLKQAEKFSWEKTARKTLEAYLDIGSSRRRKRGVGFLPRFPQDGVNHGM